MTNDRVTKAHKRARDELIVWAASIGRRESEIAFTRPHLTHYGNIAGLGATVTDNFGRKLQMGCEVSVRSIPIDVIL